MAWVAGLTLALSFFAPPARAEVAFTAEGATLACPGSQPEALARHGNIIFLPSRTEAELRNCRVAVEFSVRNEAAAKGALASGNVELIGLKLARAAFPVRLAVGTAGVDLAAGRSGNLILSLSTETLFGGERRHGVALILAYRAGEGEEARSYLSPTLLIERSPPTPQRMNRAGH